MAESKLNRQRILIVDDEKIIRSVLIDILEMNGYDPVPARNGQEAIDMMRNAPFDLILTDIVMPKATGVDVLRVAKELDPLYPVIMVTAYPSRESVRKMISLGAADYIIKPFSVDTVVVTIDKVLEMHSQFAKLLVTRDTTLEPGIDPLTGAFSASTFTEIVRHEIARCQRLDTDFCLLNIMVDNYRTGVARADTLRKRFAEVLLNAARPGDIVGRTGVDDFTLLLPQTEPKIVQVAFQRVNKSTEVWNLRGGLTRFPDHGDSPNALIGRARALCEKARSKDYQQGLRILTPAVARVRV